MKRVYISLLFLVAHLIALTQNVGISETLITPHSSAILEVRSTNKGILIPRVALTQTTSASPVTSPEVSLLVYNTASVNDVMPGYYYWNGTRWVRLLNDGNVGAAWSLSGNSIGGAEFIGTTNAQPFRIFTNNVERLRVTADGRVGINTTSIQSGARLHVHEGWVFVSSAGTVDAVVRTFAEGGLWANHDAYVYSASSHPAFVGLRGRGTLSSPSYPQLNDILVEFTGRDVIDGYIGTAQHGGAAIFMTASQNWSSSAKGAHMIFSTTSNNSTAPTERMRITHSGDVGIGTSAPQQRLHIQGNLHLSGAFMPNGNAGTSGQVLVSQGAGNPPTWQTLGGMNINFLEPHQLFTFCNSGAVVGWTEVNLSSLVPVGTRGVLIEAEWGISAPDAGDVDAHAYVRPSLSVAGCPTCNTVSINMTNGSHNISGCGNNCVNFYDSGGPSANYSNNEALTYTFYSQAGSAIQVSGTYDIESGYDYLYIDLDCDGSYDFTYSGGGSINLTSVGNCIRFRFTSDGSVTYTGWDLTLHVIAAGSGYLVARGRSAGSGDSVAGSSQIFAPIDQSNRRFYYRVEPPGFNHGLIMRVIGYW